jgi:hypothetical protein
MSILISPRGEHSLQLRIMEGQTENFTPRGQNSPKGASSPLGSKLAPRGEVNGHQGCQIFLGPNIPNGISIPNDHKLGIPNCHKIYQMAVKYT